MLAGIGLMIAHALSANGAKVYIVGRREEELKKVADMYTPSGNGAIIPLPGWVRKAEAATPSLLPDGPHAPTETSPPRMAASNSPRRSS